MIYNWVHQIASVWSSQTPAEAVIGHSVTARSRLFTQGSIR